MKIELLQLENKVKSLENQKNSLDGKVSLLDKQVKDLENKVETIKYQFDLNKKCIEFLLFVQKTNQDLIKDSFEKIVTEALQFILGDGYYFKLEFGKRGNLGELNFNIITPEKKEPSDLVESSAGGELDVVSLALRIVLLELQVPKNKGFLFLDEPFSKLRGQEYLQNANRFLKVVNEKFKRQIFVISHEEEFKK